MKEYLEKNFLRKLGLARRAGETVIGQDRLRAAISAGKGPFILFFSQDASPAVERRLAGIAHERAKWVFHLETVSRWELGAALGLASAQVVGLRTASQFTEMLLEDLRREGDVIE